MILMDILMDIGDLCLEGMKLLCDSELYEVIFPIDPLTSMSNIIHLLFLYFENVSFLPS